MQTTTDIDIPVVCSLSPAELEERQNRVLAQMSQAILETRETATGYTFRFAPAKETITQLAQVIALESECCPFITFQLTATSGNGPLWLELIVPEDAKPLVASFFHVN